MNEWCRAASRRISIKYLGDRQSQLGNQLISDTVQSSAESLRRQGFAERQHLFPKTLTLKERDAFAVESPGRYPNQEQSTWPCVPAQVYNPILSSQENIASAPNNSLLLFRSIACRSLEGGVGVKVHVAQARWPDFDPQNPHETLTVGLCTWAQHPLVMGRPLGRGDRKIGRSSWPS